jgi:excisionase family DNA binding protein
MTNAFEKEGLSVTEASEIAGIGRTKIYEAISDGRIKARKLGKRTLILRSDLHRFLQKLPTVESVVVKPSARNVEVAIASESGQRQQKEARRGANR